MVDPMKGKQTLKAAELQDGDIICFQKSGDSKSSSDSDKRFVSAITTLNFSTESPSSNVSSAARSNQTIPVSRSSTQPTGRIEDAKEFYDYLLYRKIVRLLPHPKSTTSASEPIDIEMSVKFSYDQMAARVAEKTGADPTHIRFYTVNSATGQPRTPVKRNPTQTLQQILQPPYSSFGNNNQKSDALYYEILDMSLSELDTKKNLKVTWISEGITKDVSLFQR
jgi:ubiquitin carboxyl-terminal hydrolase 7